MNKKYLIFVLVGILGFSITFSYFNAKKIAAKIFFPYEHLFFPPDVDIGFDPRLSLEPYASEGEGTIFPLWIVSYETNQVWGHPLEVYITFSGQEVYTNPTDLKTRLNCIGK